METERQNATNTTPITLCDGKTERTHLMRTWPAGCTVSQCHHRTGTSCHPVETTVRTHNTRTQLSMSKEAYHAALRCGRVVPTTHRSHMAGNREQVIQQLRFFE
jgi:hypothetical protein